MIFASSFAKAELADNAPKITKSAIKFIFFSIHYDPLTIINGYPVPDMDITSPLLLFSY
jgi:hypothetical protein